MSSDLKNQPSWWEPIQKYLDSKLVSWGIPGIFIGLAADQARQLKWNPFWQFVGLAALAWVAIKVGSRLLPYFDRFLDWLFKALERQAQILWAKLTDRFEVQYFQRLEYDCRDFEGRGFNAGALQLEDVFVPLKLTERSAREVPQDILRQGHFDPLAQQKIGELIRQVAPKRSLCRHLVLLGAPGSGKSTLLRHVTLMYAIRKQRQLHPQVPKLVPVLIRLRDVYGQIVQEPSPALSEVIVAGLPQLATELKQRPKWFEERLRQGKCLVMLDGLDEVADPDQRRLVSQWVDQQLQTYIHTPFVLTSRPEAYRHAPLQVNAIALEVQPFSAKERNAFIYNWCQNWRKNRAERRLDAGEREKVQRQADKLITQIEATPTLRLMARNPLLLSLMARTYSEKGSLASRRVDLYGEVCQVLLEGRQRLGATGLLSAKRKQVILQDLALKMTQASMLRFTLDNVRQRSETFMGARGLIQGHLDKVPKDRPSVEAFVAQDEVGVRELLCDRKQEGIYEFAHRSFQEYLTAVELHKLGKLEFECLRAAFQAGLPDLAWWRGVICFYAAFTDATPLIQAALNHPSLPGLTLAYECLQDTEEVEQVVREALEAKVEQGLGATDPEEFKLAAQVQLRVRLNRLNPDFRDEAEFENEFSEVQDTTDITQAEYRLFLMENGAPMGVEWQGVEVAKDPQIATWQEGNRFCVWLSHQTANQFGGLGVCYRVLMPSETEPETDSNYQDTQGRIRLVRFRIPERYIKLADALAAGEWRQADELTRRLMLKIADRESQGFLDKKDVQQFPLDELRWLDRLWVLYSQGRFGFSVQKQIWLEVGGWLENENTHNAFQIPRFLRQLRTNLGVKIKGGEFMIYSRFCDRIGWRKNGKFVSYPDLCFEVSAPNGHLPRKASRHPVFKWGIIKFFSQGVGIEVYLFSRVKTSKV